MTLQTQVKCIHKLECDQCYEIFIEEFEAMERFLKLVEAAKNNNMRISPNAFAIKDLEKAFGMHFKLSKEESDRVWERIRKRLEDAEYENAGSSNNQIKP